MTIRYTDDRHYGDIASAIRSKNGTSNTYAPSEMAQAILDIPTGHGEYGHAMTVQDASCQNVSTITRAYNNADVGRVDGTATAFFSAAGFDDTQAITRAYQLTE